MAEKTVLGMDLYWLNFYGLMILTLIEVLAVGANLDPVAESLGTVSYTHLTLPTKA